MPESVKRLHHFFVITRRCPKLGNFHIFISREFSIFLCYYSKSIGINGIKSLLVVSVTTINRSTEVFHQINAVMNIIFPSSDYLFAMFIVPGSLLRITENFISLLDLRENSSALLVVVLVFVGMPF